MACTSVDTVFEVTINADPLLGITDVIFSLDSVPIADVAYDPGTPSAGVFFFPGGAGFAFVIVSINDSQVIITFSKPGSACELNGKTPEVIVDSGAGTAEVSQIVEGVCCPEEPVESGGSGGGAGFIPPEFYKVAKTLYPEGAPDQVKIRGTVYYYMNKSDDIYYYYSRNPNPNNQRPGSV